jgi:hypothetical protein
MNCFGENMQCKNTLRMTDSSASNQKPMLANPSVMRDEFELACIREFSHSGHRVGVGVSRAERRERIRAAIQREHKSALRWHNSTWTYAAAFAQAYQQTLETGDMRAPEPWSQGEDYLMDDTEGKEILDTRRL